MSHVFDELRPRLFGIAYRMLGSVADAEDIVQEAFLRWQSTNPEDIRVPKAFLTTVVTRLCMDHLKSAKVQRETYIGPWLPEPLIASPGAQTPLELSDSLSMAFLVLLESLSPVERAVFLLHEVFDYDFEEIAAIVQKSPVNCRQIASRSRQHITNRRPRFEVTGAEHEVFASDFLSAVAAGDLEQLMSMMTADVVATSDGGGKALAARRPIAGANNVGRFLIGIFKKAPPGLTYRWARVNGQIGLVVFLAGRARNVITFEIAEGKLRNLYLVLAPDKLQRLPLTDQQV